VTAAQHLLQLSHAWDSINYVNDCPQDLMLEGDPQRLQQVFVNLLNNARDASPAGANVEVAARLGADGNVEIRVSDQGKGIPAEFQERIFEPFFTTKEVGQGTGLGLSVVYNIIRNHGGDIRVRSQPGQGTDVIIHLPYRRPTSGQASVAP
jgi:signal transduction histidine kinase